ncbi:MAG TPA: hypothetical protein VN026_06260 [Bacteroidia bacterium]|jgi:hypothetical protein|nr:hypothetical protein [Bacteroidia bacterium]
MKKILYISVLVFLFVSACSRKKHSEKNKTEERIEIIPFYQNQVTLKDLHQIDTNLFLVEPEEFLDKESFIRFTNAMWALVKNPNSKVFYDGYDTTKVTYKDLIEHRFMQCDSVIPVDSLNNPVGPHLWACDSTSRMNEISRIYFYESWYLNTKTNLIEKETLGYSVWQYVKDKDAYRELFVVFCDEKAVEKAKKYYFN